MAAIAIADIGTESGDFYFQLLLRNKNHPELRTYGHVFREEPYHLIGRGVRRHVVIGRFTAK